MTNLKKKYFLGTALCVSIFACNSFALAAGDHQKVPTSAAHCLNNEIDDVDYKVDSLEFEGVAESFLDAQNIERDETGSFLNLSPSKSFDSLEGETDSVKVAKSYLLENDVLHRPINLSWDGKHYVVGEEASWCSDDSTLLKSDLLLMLSKIEWGTQSISSLVLKNSSVRNEQSGAKAHFNYWKKGKVVSELQDYWGSGLDATFDVGDFYFYKNPNVYELYFKKLLDMGILKKSDFSNSQFIKEYEQCVTDDKPAWLTGGIVTIENKGVFGQSFSYDNDSVDQKKPNYFGDSETLSVMDALRLIETFMRITEKDISETEAGIVTYKYGITYLSKFEEEDQRTLSFLIAKGVLDYDKDNFGLNLFGDATYADIYEVLYRVANPEARLDFSKIQLTDSENFWKAKGFCEETLALYSVDNPPIMRTVEAEVISTQSKGILNTVYAVSNSAKVYRIVKQFDKVNTFFYRGVELSELALKLNSGECSFHEVKSVAEKKVEVQGQGIKDVYEVIFEYKATSKESAINYVDGNFTSKITHKETYTLSALTKISIIGEDDSESSTTRMISQDVMRECFKDISIIEDKVLYNKRTGAQAVFLPESGYALVGNRVFSNSSLFITDTNDDVYYNLSVVMALLSNSDLEVLGKGSIFIWDLVSEHEATTHSATGGRLGSAYYLVATSLAGVDPDDLELEILEGEEDGKPMYYLYKLDSITNGVNTIYRKFSVKYQGNVYPVYVIVDWVFAAPDSEELNSYKMYQSGTITGDLTMNDALLALYTRPQDDKLGKWWDSNLGISNALANFIYGTRGVEYVKSGYLAPSLTVLVEDPENSHQGESDAMNGNLTSEVLNTLFTTRGFYLPSKYSQYVGGTTQNFWNSYFNSQVGCPSEFKTLAKITRRCQILLGWGDEEDGCSFGTSFYVTKNGVVYRNVEEDGRLSFDSTVSPKKITIRDRVDSEESVPVGGSVYTEGGKLQWKYLGMKTIAGKTYLQLYPMFDIIDKLDSNGESLNLSYTVPVYKSSKSGNKISWKHVKVGGQKLSDEMYTLYSQFFPDFTNYSSLLGEWNNSRFNFEYFSNDFFADSGVNVLNHTVSSSGAKKTFYYAGGTGAWKKYDATAGITAYAVPCFYLPASDFYTYQSDGKWTLGKGSLPALITKSNYFYSGLNNSIIDSMIAKSVGVSSVKVLPYGAELIIGDTVWTKKGAYWESNPIYDGRVASDATSNDSSRYQAMLCNVFTGMVVYCDDLAFNITNYFTCYGLAPVSGAETLGENACACLDANGVPSVYRNGSYSPLPCDGVATAVCIRMKIDDSFLVRPVDDTGKHWVACHSASESLVNGLNVPFFSESLSYDSGGLSRVTLGESYYHMTGMFNEKKDKSDIGYKTLFWEDLSTLILVIIICLVSYLAVMSYVSYFMLTQGMGRFFLEALVTKTENGKFKGVDVLKIMTFGIYSLDNDPSLMRVVVTSLVCFMIASICLGHL